MVNSPVRKRNSVRNSSRAKSVGRIQFWLWLACFYVACLAGVAVQAAITTSGNLDPPYPGGDHWNVGGLLTVAYTADGSMTINGDSYVLDTGGSIGYSTGTTGTVTVDGTGSSWINGGWVVVGLDGSGSLTVQNGGSVSNTYGWVGFYVSGTGTVTIDGNGSSWNNITSLSIGSDGSGTLTVQNGGTVWVGDAASSGGAAGWLTVSDSDNSGTAGGHLYVYNGSTLTNGGSAILGDESEEYGWATVSGFGSSWTNGGWLFVGFHGSSTLTVQNGGSVSNTDGWIGYYTGGTGTVTVTGSGSTWENTEDLSLGRSSDSGVGHLTTYSDGTVYVGDAASSGGMLGWWLTVSDSDGSGASGGHLFVYNGSTLTHGGNAVVGDGDGEFGWVTVDGTGSSWANSGELFVGFHGGSGTLTVQDGGSVSSTYGLIGYYPGATGTVTIDGIDSVWTNSGQLLVGRSGQGTLTITEGGRVSVAGTLAIDWDTNGDSFINMATGGKLALFGDADESLGDFLDLIDGTDAIRYWNETITDWADITGATMGTDYTLAYIDATGSDLENYTVLTVGTATILLPGDFDRDGDVDGVDFLIWQRGESPFPLSQSDLDAWQANFGTAASPMTAASTGVPEPTTGLMLMLGMASLLFRRAGF